MATGEEWLGEDHPAVQCLQYGIALHHAGLPRPFLNDVERLLKSGDCPLTIASPTLAQGLNLSAGVLLVPSIWRNQRIIPAAELANVAGRAGRAFVDLEGLVLHVVWEIDLSRRKWAERQWEKLVAEAKAPEVSSGLLVLTTLIYKRISAATGIPLDEVVEYVTGHGDAWDFNESAADKVSVSAADWERDVASLDAAILALLDAEAEETSLDSELDSVLEGSLFSRQLAQEEQNLQALLRRFLVARAHRIWTQTSTPQRKGYHLAGIGLRAGQFLDANIMNLIALLLRAEAAMINRDTTATADAVVGFAELVFQVTPFRSPGDIPDTWRNALRAWIEGRAASEVVSIGGDGGVDLLQDALTYRLPWAMEAVRVHAGALGQESADQLQGLAGLAVEAGSVNRSVVMLLRSGLSSREAAMAAVATTGASFVDRAGMKVWLRSKETEQFSANDDWPTPQSRHTWLQFYDGEKKGDRRKWMREIQTARVDWFGDVPKPGIHVVVETDAGADVGLVLTPDFVRLGVLKSSLRRPHRDIVKALVGDKPGTISVEFFGPQPKHRRIASDNRPGSCA